MPSMRETEVSSNSRPGFFVSVWRGFKTFVTWLIILTAVAMAIFTVVSMTVFDRNDRNLFGYKAFIVHSDSMSATDFSAGDLVIVKEVDPAVLQVGDIIAFMSSDPKCYGETFTHKIRELTTNENGNPAFVTYGTTTNDNDLYPVSYARVLGQYKFRLKGFGKFFAFLKTVPGYICCIFVPIVLLCVIQGIDSIRLFRRYKDEQIDEIESHRHREMEEMAAERDELKRLLAEFKQMQNSSNYPAADDRPIDRDIDSAPLAQSSFVYDDSIDDDSFYDFLKENFSDEESAEEYIRSNGAGLFGQYFLNKDEAE